MVELSIDGVGKRYGRERWALRDVTLRPGGGVFGLVGPNGAGKTTLLRILATLLHPSEGVVTWRGADLARDPTPLRRTLGYLPQDFGVYPQLTAREFLRYIGELKGLSGPTLARQVTTVLAAVRLEAEADRRLREFSGGMVRRIGIAQALLAEPRLLVLDEPTVGLDPAERVHFRELLTSFGRDRIIVLSTHIIADIEAVATDLALLQQGRVAWTGSPTGLLADAAGSAWALTLPTTEFASHRADWQVSVAVRDGEMISARLVAPASPHPQAVPVTPTLEEAYLRFATEPSTAASPTPIPAAVAT